MPKTIVFSDVHGNLIALEIFIKLLEEIEFEQLICLGDSIGYYPDGSACLDIIMQLKAKSIMGNHESMILGKIPTPLNVENVAQLKATKESLRTDQIEQLGKFDEEYVVSYGNKTFEFYHGSPQDKVNGYLYLESNVIPNYPNKMNVVVVGNTHRSYKKDFNWGSAINVGSVGLPRDCGNLATFVEIDTVNFEAKRHLFELPTEKIRKKYSNAHPNVLEILDRRETIANFI